MAGQLAVRRLRPDDGPALVAAGILAPPAERDASEHQPPSPDAPSGGMAPADVAAMAEAGCSWLAERDGEPVGVLLAQPIAFVDDAPLTFWVEQILVAPEERRRGVATALYRAFGAWARAAGARGVLTRLDPNDASAWALHRRVGFEPHGTGALLWRLGSE